MSGARRFSGESLRGAMFTDVDLSGSRWREVTFHGARMVGVEMGDVEISGEVERLVVNGVDVAPLVEAELDRRDPDRPLMRPTDVAGFREAWDVVESRWSDTLGRARELERRDPALLHEQVDGEWSFVETLRHLVFATESWVGRALLGDPSPWHPLSLPWDSMPDIEGVPRDRTVRPGLDEVLALRRSRMGLVRGVLDDLTEERLAGVTVPPDGAGWPPPREFGVREVLLIVLNEEYHHRLFAERDLAVLAGQ